MEEIAEMTASLLTWLMPRHGTIEKIYHTEGANSTESDRYSATGYSRGWWRAMVWVNERRRRVLFIDGKWRYVEDPVQPSSELSD